MAGDENTNETLNDLDPEWPVKVIKCFEHKHVLRCFKTLLQEKTKTKGILDKIREVAKVSVAREESSLGQLSLKKLSALLDIWEKSLNSHLQQEVSEIFEKPEVFNVSDLAIKFLTENNGTLQLALGSSNETEVAARGMKMKMNMKNMMPYMLVPGLFLAGIMPWVVPQLKMLVMMVGMMSQMAFSTALFSLVRGYIFDTSQTEHIFYINHGYKNEKHHPKHHPKHHSLKKEDVVNNNKYQKSRR